MLVDVLPRPKGFSFSDAITTVLGMELPLPRNVHRAIVIDLEERYHRAAQRAYLD